MVDDRTIILTEEGDFDMVATAAWWTKRYQSMTDEQRAESDRLALEAADRMDPSGRLRHLIEIGPEGYERERRGETADQ